MTASTTETTVREAVHAMLAPHIRKGEQLYYEIYGYDVNGGCIQITGGQQFAYDCRPGEYKVVLYRVTITTPDGYVIDLPRHLVYARADELGLARPPLLDRFQVPVTQSVEHIVAAAQRVYTGRSTLDAGTMREGAVVWYQDPRLSNGWTCLKLKSEEFLLLESKDRSPDDTGAPDPEESHLTVSIEEIAANPEIYGDVEDYL